MVSSLLVPIYYVAISPSGFTPQDCELIDKRISKIRKKGILQKLKKETPQDALDYSFRYLLQESGINDIAYGIDREAKNLALATVFFNAEAARHAAEQSFSIIFYREGLLKINWEVPNHWKSYHEKVRRLVERVLADTVWRAFEKKGFSYDLFHHPSHYMQGFGFDQLDIALSLAVQSLHKKYSKFINYYRMVRNWKNIYLLKKQVELLRNKIDTVVSILDLDKEVGNSTSSLLADLERKLELESIDCVVNDVVLWELSDTL